MDEPSPEPPPDPSPDPSPEPSTETLPEPQPFSASMAIFYDTIPLQVTIGTMPSTGTPFKVVYQNQPSSVYLGPLECNTPLGSTLSEAFIWEQLLGTSDSERREELVTEMMQVAQTGMEWRQAVPMVTLVTVRPTIGGESAIPEEEADQVNSGQLRLLSIMTPNDDYKPHSSGVGKSLEPPREGDMKEPYSMVQLIRVTAKTWWDAASGQ
eukprot:gene21205-28112_t